MGIILMLTKELAIEKEITVVGNASLPLYYMSDYSVLALRVEKFELAKRHLEKQRFPLKKLPFGIEVVVNGIRHLQAILQLFATHGVNAEFTDIATPIYQG